MSQLKMLKFVWHQKWLITSEIASIKNTPHNHSSNCILAPSILWPNLALARNQRVPFIVVSLDLIIGSILLRAKEETILTWDSLTFTPNYMPNVLYTVYRFSDIGKLTNRQ